MPTIPCEGLWLSWCPLWSPWELVFGLCCLWLSVSKEPFWICPSPRLKPLEALGQWKNPWLAIDLVKCLSVVSLSHLSHVLYPLLVVVFCCLYVACHAFTCYGLFVWWCWYPTCTFTYDSLVHKAIRMLMKPLLILHGTLACWWSLWYLKQSFVDDDMLQEIHDEDFAWCWCHDDIW